MSEEILDKNKFVMPAEWEHHRATWLAWPNDDDYFETRIKNVEKIYLEIIKHLYKNESIKLLVSEVCFCFVTMEAKKIIRTAPTMTTKIQLNCTSTCDFLPVNSLVVILN